MLAAEPSPYLVITFENKPDSASLRGASVVTFLIEPHQDIIGTTLVEAVHHGQHASA